MVNNEIIWFQSYALAEHFEKKAKLNWKRLGKISSEENLIHFMCNNITLVKLRVPEARDQLRLRPPI